MVGDEILRTLGYGWDTVTGPAGGVFAFGYVSGDETLPTIEAGVVRSGDHLKPGWYVTYHPASGGHIQAYRTEDYETAEEAFRDIRADLAV